MTSVCPHCGPNFLGAGVDALGFLSGPHALHHAVEVKEDGLLECCCGGVVEVNLVAKEDFIQRTAPYKELEEEHVELEKERDALSKDLEKTRSDLDEKLDEQAAEHRKDLEELEEGAKVARDQVDLLTALVEVLAPWLVLKDDEISCRVCKDDAEIVPRNPTKRTKVLRWWAGKHAHKDKKEE